MTDRELIELAAKAAGIDLVWDCPPTDWPPMVYDGDIYHQWIPLDDDGDALRLAVKLSIDLNFCSYDVEAAHGSNMHTKVFIEHGDIYAATRRAIVRVAAEIGRAMP